MAKLHILSETSVAQTIDLKADLISVGRTEQNEICIPDKSVSKRHAMLVRDGNEYQLHDFNATNGTFVDGERVMAVKLHDGASIRLGFVELRYESGTANAATAPVNALAPEVLASLGAKEPEAPKLPGAERPSLTSTPPPKPAMVAAPDTGMVRASDEGRMRPSNSGARGMTPASTPGLLQSKPATFQPGSANKPALRTPPPAPAPAPPPAAPEPVLEKKVEVKPAAAAGAEIRLRPPSGASAPGEKKIALKPAHAPHDRLHAGPVKKHE
jgi:predicted component of type VI protein secretion system